MSLTPNFGMNIPDSTDIVNLLTQCYPNFTLLDTVLQTIKESGTTVATETKVGTTHQLVRVVPDCAVIRFVATSNYTAGDTFTVDGNVVTANAPDGTSLPTGAYVINQNVFAILTGTQLTVYAGEAHTALGTSFDNTGTNYVSTNVEGALKEVGPKGSVSVTADGVKTYAQVLADLHALIDYTKLSKDTTLCIDTSGQLAYSRLYAVNPNTYVKFHSESFTNTFTAISEYHVAPTSLMRYWLINTSGNSFTDDSASVAPAGTKYEVFY